MSQSEVEGIRPRSRQSLSRSVVATHIRTPLYRDGYALALDTGLVSVLGIVYWVLATRNYPAEIIGLNSAAISALMFVAGLSQLNLMSALTRFVPVTGASTTRFVVFSYLVSVTLAVGVAAMFLIGVRLWTPELAFLTSSSGFALCFTLAAMACCIHNLQDSVLTGLRAALVVPVENLVFSIAKIVLLVALVGPLPRYGVFASWTIAFAVSVVPVNLVIFKWLLPRHIRRSGNERKSPTRRQVMHFVSADLVGAFFWLATATLMPVAVVTTLGVTANAYFSIAWMIMLAMYAVIGCTGASLVVTGSRNESRLPCLGRQALMQTAGLVFPLAVVMAAGSSLVLRLFGAEYAANAATTLSLLALSAIPWGVTWLYVSAYRVRRSMSRALVLQSSACALGWLLAAGFMQLLGVVGVGVGWLLAQCVVVAILLFLEPRTLWPSRPRASEAASTL